MKNRVATGGSEQPHRNAAAPFTLFLTGEPYYLTMKDLKDQTDSILQRKRTYYHPQITVHSYEAQEVVLELFFEDIIHLLTVQVASDKLQLSCNCGSSVRTLCLHAYRTLEQLIMFDRTPFFKAYAPGGLMEMVKKHGRYFEKTMFEKPAPFTPKTQLGFVYGISLLFDEWSPSTALSYPAPQEPMPEPDPAITPCFFIAYSYRFKRLPILLPCSGSVTVAGTAIKSFNHYFRGFEPENLHLLTSQQQELNLLSQQIWAAAEQVPGILSEAWSFDAVKTSQVFGWWQQAFQLLASQEFVFTNWIGKASELNGRPEKLNTNRMKIRKERPRLLFKLQDKGEYLHFTPVIQIRKKRITDWHVRGQFLLETDTELFLLASLRDAAVLAWMGRMLGKCSIFKEHFQAFEQEVLIPLAANYTIEDA